MSHLAPVWYKVTDLDVVSGEGSWVTTADGTRYLDFTSGIAVTSTGHCHPQVVAAIQEQAAVHPRRSTAARTRSSAGWPMRSTV
ncbi:MAG: aminotransferase class III-fold pyridoxal phosphate-dependent enzyme [Acidimicrobiales bacterium]